MLSNFLADRPELKDKLLACAVFSGIAVGGASGVNMVLTGGFDFLTPGREIREAAPSSYVTVVPANMFEQGQVIQMTSNEPLFSGQVTQVSQDLAGASDDASAPSGHYPQTSDDGGDALYQQLAARYGGQPTPQSLQNFVPAAAVAGDDDSKPATSVGSDSDTHFAAVEADVLQAVPAALEPEKPPA